MTTSWSRSPMRSLRYSRDNVKKLQKRSKCCRWSCRSVIIRLRLHNCQNPQFRCGVVLILFMEVVGCMLPSWLRQFIDHHLLLPKPLHALLYRFSDCAHRISNNTSFHLNHPGVPEGSDGCDGTSYPLTENLTLPVAQATGRVAYLPLLLCARYTHNQNNTCVILFAGAAVML
jgi:hypothetical protein